MTATPKRKPKSADDDMPEITAEQWKHARRGRFAGKAMRMSMVSLRVALGKTQVELAKASGIDQGDVSRLERRVDLDEVLVGTIARYVEALGGRLELTAEIGGRRYVLASGGPKVLR